MRRPGNKRVPARHIPGAPRTGFIGDAIHPFPRSGTWRERLAIALANNFFKWGLMPRVADPEAVQLAAK